MPAPSGVTLLCVVASFRGLMSTWGNSCLGPVVPILDRLIQNSNNMSGKSNVVSRPASLRSGGETGGCIILKLFAWAWSPVRERHTGGQIGGVRSGSLAAGRRRHHVIGAFR